MPGLRKASRATAVHQGGPGPYLSLLSCSSASSEHPLTLVNERRRRCGRVSSRAARWHLAWIPPTALSGLSPGTLKVLFFVLASVCAWYSGYLLAELIPDVSLSSAVYSIQGIGDRVVLKGQYRGSPHTKDPAARLV